MISNTEVRDTIKLIYGCSRKIEGTKGEEYLAKNLGIKITDLPINHNLKYLENCPNYNSKNGCFPAIVAKISDKNNKIIGLLTYNLRKKEIQTIGTNTKNGVVIMGDCSSPEIIITKDFICALKLSKKYKKTVYAHIEDKHLYNWHPQIRTIKSIEMHVESPLKFKQLRIGGKVDDFWKGQKIEIACKILSQNNLAAKNRWS